MDAFQVSVVVGLAAGEANGGAFTVVPTGKLAVIEHVSVHASGAGAQSGDYFVTSTIEGDSGFREVPVVTHVTPTGAALGSHPLRAYAGADSQFGGVVRRLDTNGNVAASFVLAGYYLPLA